MSIKRTNSQSYIKNRPNSGSIQRTSDRYTSKDNKAISSNTQIRASHGVLLQKPQKLIELSKQKRQIAPEKLKLMRHVFNTISNSSSSKIWIFICLNYLEL
jgi:hypothetical protein